MNEQEVKDLIGEENWKDFLHWMHGQTIGVNKDGSYNYYDWDVERYNEGLKW